MSKQPFNFMIDIPMQNHWENVDLMRNSILNCFGVLFRGVDGVHSFATVAAELMENAIKYGHWKDERVSHLHVRVWGDSAAAHVQVENPVDAESAHVAELVRTIDWLHSQPSAETAYRSRLLEVAASPRGMSRLGLARIAYEGGCSLDATIIGDRLRVTSITRFDETRSA